MFQVYDWADNQEKGCGILSGMTFYTDNQSVVFEGQLRNTQTAYYGLSFFKVAASNALFIRQADHRLGTALINSSVDTVKSISGPQLKAVQAVADGIATTGNLSNTVEHDAVQPDKSSPAGTGGLQPNAALVASASAALPHLLASASRASAASPSTTTSGLALL